MKSALNPGADIFNMVTSLGEPPQRKSYFSIAEIL
jgi:hypothetical protein